MSVGYDLRDVYLGLDRSTANNTDFKPLFYKADYWLRIFSTCTATPAILF